MKEPLSSSSFLSVLNSSITLSMNLWKYLLSCLWGAEGCSAAGDPDSDMLWVGLFRGGPAGEAEISASASKSRRTTYEKTSLRHGAVVYIEMLQPETCPYFKKTVLFTDKK